MNAFVAVRKLIQGVVLLFLVAIIIFIIFRLMPGNPADLILLSLKSKPTLTQKQALLQQFGLQNGKWSYQAFTTFTYDPVVLAEDASGPKYVRLFPAEVLFTLRSMAARSFAT